MEIMKRERETNSNLLKMIGKQIQQEWLWEDRRGKDSTLTEMLINDNTHMFSYKFLLA
jgi:hypothetical protein